MKTALCYRSRMYFQPDQTSNKIKNAKNAIKTRILSQSPQKETKLTRQLRRESNTKKKTTANQKEKQIQNAKWRHAVTAWRTRGRRRRSKRQGWRRWQHRIRPCPSPWWCPGRQMSRRRCSLSRESRSWRMTAWPWPSCSAWAEIGLHTGDRY